MFEAILTNYRELREGEVRRLHATEDPLPRVLLRLFRQALHVLG
jgi:hypothetical protein